MKKAQRHTVTDIGRPPRGFDPEDVRPAPLPDGPWRVAALALDLSGNCNLACRYCAEAATQPRRRPKMSPETLDAACDLLLEPDGTGRKVSLRFGSGEPMLGWPLLQQARARCEQYVAQGGTPPEVFLTTNGTRIDEPAAEWLQASGWHVKISLDGPAAVHNAWRVAPGGRPTYARVAGAVTRLAHAMPDRLSVTAVLCRGADPGAVFDAIAELGVRRIELVPVAHHDEAVRPAESDAHAYAGFVQEYARRYARGAPGLPVLVRFARCVTRLLGYGNARVPCGAGRSFLAVGPGGDLYPCFRFIGVEPYRLGTLAGGVDASAAAAFRHGAGRVYEQRVPCEACWAAALCGGPCFACAEMFGPGDGRPIAQHCAYTLADARAAVWLVNRLRARAPERLLEFLPARIGPL